jgi:hypothetical protein
LKGPCKASVDALVQIPGALNIGTVHNHGVRQLATVQHGTAAGRSAHDAEACPPQSIGLPPTFGRLVPPERERRLAPSIETEQGSAWLS